MASAWNTHGFPCATVFGTITERPVSPPLARSCFVAAVVALDEAGTAAIGPGLFFFKPHVRAFEAVVVRLDELLGREIRPRGRRRKHVLLDPVRDGFGIFQAVWMMRVSVLDHHGDAPATLLIGIF